MSQPPSYVLAIRVEGGAKSASEVLLFGFDDAEVQQGEQERRG
jgi:hypothetical protein